MSESVLQEAERIINGPRRDAYGPVKDSFQKVADGWALILSHPVTAKQVALCMAWLKLMRETNKASRDNLVDMAGYTGLAAQIDE